MPYIAAHPLEFQTLGQWGASGGGLGPVETTMLIALPEIDGATNPTVYAGRHDTNGCKGCDKGCHARSAEALTTRAMAPCPERIEALADKAARLARLRQSRVGARKVAVVLYGFPPNAGAAGTAAYLSVFESLHNVLHAMQAEGYDVTPPASVEDLRDAVLGGNASSYGQPANVAATVSAAEIVARSRWLRDVEAAWGPAPAARNPMAAASRPGPAVRQCLRRPAAVFGYEGDPMRLLFEKGFAPTHAFTTFYRWLREDFGPTCCCISGCMARWNSCRASRPACRETCWPDRLIGNLPNVYLYAANNPSEATLAKRRSNAVTITHLTPPLAQSGLYKGLADLKDSLSALPRDGAGRARPRRPGAAGRPPGPAWTWTRTIWARCGSSCWKPKAR